MFKAKKLSKLVEAQIITPMQKQQILDYEDNSSWVLVMRALAMLGIFTMGVGAISLIASNWHEIGRDAKLGILFAVLFGASGLAIFWRQKGADEKSEKMLLGLFFLVGAGIGLIIQIFQLNGGNIYTPFGLWCLVTLPLLVVAKRKYVAYFWVPLFLAWNAMYVGDSQAEFVTGMEILMALFALFAGIGGVFVRFLPKFSAGSVLKKSALVAFYLVLAAYIATAGFSRGGLAVLGKAAGILALLSAIYCFLGDYRRIRLNIKFAGLLVMMLYINLGSELGLFETGIGLIFSGAVLLLFLKMLPKVLGLVQGEKKNVEKC